MFGEEELQGGAFGFGDACVLGAYQRSSVERTFTVDNEAVLLGKNIARRIQRRRIAAVNRYFRSVSAIWIVRKLNIKAT